MHRSAAVVLVVVAALLASPRARAEDSPPSALEGVGIFERPGAQVPLDATFTNQDGKAVRLADYLGDKPVVMVLAYYECPMLCTVVLNGLRDGMSGLAWTPGQDYRALVLSFDPRDKVEMARAKRASYVEALGRPIADRGWDFLVGSEGQVRRVAEAVGFRYRWDEDSRQFAHAAGAFVLTPEGRVSRTLYGIRFSETDLRLSLSEASQGKLGSATERLLLFCYHYDPIRRAYIIAPVQIMKLGGALTVGALSTFLLALWGWETRAARRAREDLS